MRRAIDWIIPALVVARCAWIFSFPLRTPQLQLGLAEDDFYYYLKPAQNLAWFHHPTAFQNVWTNGYHPLYFLLLTLVSTIVKTIPGVYHFLWGLDTLSAAAIFFLTRGLFARLSSTLLANALATAVTGLCVVQICFQMEVTLALPLGFGFLLAGFVSPQELTRTRAAWIGLLGALTFLARLDAGLLIFLYIAAVLASREYRRAIRPAVAFSFLACCMPLPLLYFWTNLHFFHVALPISSMAKELRHGFAPSFLLFGTFAGLNKVLCLLAVAAAVLAYALRRHLSPREKVILFATLAHPFLFYGLEMWVSDWPVWPWYFYSLRFSAVGCAVVLCLAASRSEFVKRQLSFRKVRVYETAAAITLAVALGKTFASGYAVNPWMLEIQHAAGVLDRFSKAHPGVYAMGDRSGMFAITTASPVLQTEGLLMDKTYLQHIRDQDKLRDVLSLYGVNYYVVFAPRILYAMQFSNGCFHAMEPLLAGPMSMRMRSNFCEEPVFRFPGFDGIYSIYAINPRQEK